MRHQLKWSQMISSFCCVLFHFMPGRHSASPFKAQAGENLPLQRIFISLTAQCKTNKLILKLWPLMSVCRQLCPRCKLLEWIKFLKLWCFNAIILSNGIWTRILGSNPSNPFFFLANDISCISTSSSDIHQSDSNVIWTYVPIGPLRCLRHILIFISSSCYLLIWHSPHNTLSSSSDVVWRLIWLVFWDFDQLCSPCGRLGRLIRSATRRDPHECGKDDGTKERMMQVEEKRRVVPKGGIWKGERDDL